MHYLELSLICFPGFASQLFRHRIIEKSQRTRPSKAIPTTKPVLIVQIISFDFLLSPVVVSLIIPVIKLSFKRKWKPAIYCITVKPAFSYTLFSLVFILADIPFITFNRQRQKSVYISAFLCSSANRYNRT